MGFSKKLLNKRLKTLFFMTNSKRLDFEDSKTHRLFENWPILADFLTKSFRKKIFRANFKHKPCENCKLEIYPKFGPKIQFYGPEWCFLVHTNPIDEKNRQKNFSLNKGAILLQHLASRSDTHQVLLQLVSSASQNEPEIFWKIKYFFQIL